MCMHQFPWMVGEKLCANKAVCRSEVHLVSNQMLVNITSVCSGVCFHRTGFPCFAQIDFHRFSFKIRRPTTGRFHPTKVQKLLRQNVALLWCVGEAQRSWVGMIWCRGIFFHTRLMSYCRCFDKDLVEYILSWVIFPILSHYRTSCFLCDIPWNRSAPTLFLTELRPGAISSPNTTWSWKEMVLCRSPNEKPIFVNQKQVEEPQKSRPKNRSCEIIPDFVIKILWPWK